MFSPLLLLLLLLLPQPTTLKQCAHFFRLAMEKEKHRQQTIKRHLILSLICKQDVLISSGIYIAM
jgi:hypothetical protein